MKERLTKTFWVNVCSSVAVTCSTPPFCVKTGAEVVTVTPVDVLALVIVPVTWLWLFEMVPSSTETIATVNIEIRCDQMVIDAGDGDRRAQSVEEDEPQVRVGEWKRQRAARHRVIGPQNGRVGPVGVKEDFGGRRAVIGTRAGNGEDDRAAILAGTGVRRGNRDRGKRIADLAVNDVRRRRAAADNRRYGVGRGDAQNRDVDRLAGSGVLSFLPVSVIEPLVAPAAIVMDWPLAV